MNNPYKIKTILIHLSIWCCFLLFPLTTAILELGNIPEKMLYRLLSTPVLFYANFSFLIPKLLLRKKIILYLIVSIVFLIIFNLIAFQFAGGLPFERIEHLVEENQVKFVKSFKFAIPFALTLSIFLLGGIFKIVLTYFEKERDSKLLENQQKEIQLQFLRTQLNPHFLFNSLNSIYSLVRSKSNEAPEAVITLSELMRYMLYEVEEEKVPLEKELDYIKNYISLQKLRLKDSQNVRSNIKGETKGLYIPPLLLISFIENAFKYGTDFKGNTEIDIAINITENTLNFNIKNIIGLHQSKSKDSGIGLANIKNQLNNLYGNNYKLHMGPLDNYFIVDLTLKLK